MGQPVQVQVLLCAPNFQFLQWHGIKHTGASLPRTSGSLPPGNFPHSAPPPPISAGCSTAATPRAPPSNWWATGTTSPPASAWPSPATPALTKTFNAAKNSAFEPGQLQGNELWLDGYNVLTVLESALAGGIVLLCRDGCCRDIAGIHRRYRKINETIPVLRLVGETAAALGASRCRWWLDQPVSNSGRLKTLILEEAARVGWNMEVELTFSPDHVLSHTGEIIATSDGIVLDRCQRWVNLARLIIADHLPQARLLDLAPTGD